MSLPHECKCGICQRTLTDGLLHATSRTELAYLSRPEGSLHKLDTDTHVFFYEQEFYVLSNFSSFQVCWPRLPDGYWHQTAEHLYHYLKFRPDDGVDSDQKGKIIGVKQRIFTAHSAHEAFAIAQQNKSLRRPDWDEVKVGLMREILFQKATQHEYVRRKLLQTGDRILVEDSWRDDYWGWGPNKDGQNMLGKCWMEVREVLRKEKS